MLTRESFLTPRIIHQQHHRNNAAITEYLHGGGNRSHAHAAVHVLDFSDWGSLVCVAPDNLGPTIQVLHRLGTSPSPPAV